MIYDALRTFTPDADGLLRRISSSIDDDMLAEIAAADYGRNIPEQLAALKLIRCGGAMPAPLPWEPKEVLELIRWSEPEEEKWSPGGHGARGHWMRAFACTALLRASGEPENKGHFEGQNQTLVQLLWSIETLGGGLELDAARFLVWLLGQRPHVAPGAERGDPDEDTAFYGLGLLWLGLRSEPAMTDAAIITLAEWVSEQEQAYNDYRCRSYGLAPARWLLGSVNYNLCHKHWERLGHAMLDLELDGRSPMAIEWVKLVGTLLAEG